MLEMTHALVACAITRHVQEPITATSLSFLSHFILDAIPHWDFGTNWRGRKKVVTGAIAIADVLLGFLFGYIFFRDSIPLPILLLVITASMIPDWMEAPWYIFFATHQKKEPAKNAGFFEHLTYGIYKIENSLHAKAQFPFGLITQIITLLFFFTLLK